MCGGVRIVSFGVDEKWTPPRHRAVFEWTAATVHIYNKSGSSPRRISLSSYL